MLWKCQQLQPHVLLKHTQMPRRPHELQPNLAFKQTHLHDAIAVLTKRHDAHGRFNDQTFRKVIITTDVKLTTKGPLCITCATIVAARPCRASTVSMRGTMPRGRLNAPIQGCTVVDLEPMSQLPIRAKTIRPFSTAPNFL